MLFRSASKKTRLMFTTIRDHLIAEGDAQGFARGKAEGKTQGIAQSLESLLETRGLPLTDALRARVTRCDDEALLQRWFSRAVTASTLDEIFED